MSVTSRSGFWGSLMTKSPSRRQAGHGDRIAFRVEVFGVFVDVVRNLGVLVAEIDAPADDVGVVLKGGVRGEIGHKEHRAGAHWAGYRLGGGQVFGGDFEIPTLSAGVVAVNAAAMRLGQDVQAAVFNGGIDEGNPAGHDQAPVAVRHEVARVLVPRHGTARVAGGLGADCGTRTSQ